MRNDTPGTGIARLLVSLALCLVFVGPVAGQVFDFDNVVMLANREEFTGYNDVWGFVGNDGREYIIQGLTTGTAWWDVTDPVNPVLVKVLSGPTSGWRDMFIIGDYCYIGCENFTCGIQIVDISDPTNPVVAGTYTATIGNSHNVFGDPTRNLIYVVGGFATTVNGGVQILDVSAPTAPVEVGKWDNKYIHDLSVEGNLLFACLIGDSRLRIIDATDPANPVNFGKAYVDPTGSVHASWPVGDGTHVLITEETGGGHVKSLDYSDPNNITLAASHNPDPGASVHNVHVQGSKVFLSWYTRGMRILDITNPTVLTELGYWDTFPDTGGLFSGNWGVYPHLPSGLSAANDRTYGLFLLKYEPTAGVLDGTVSSSAGGFLDGATVEYDNLAITQVTDATGVYKFSAIPGPAHKIRFSAFGHATDSVVVNVPADAIVTTNVTLTKLPSGGLQGTITDAGTAVPIEDADVALVGTPLLVKTDVTGVYSFPDVPSASYSLRVVRYGYVVPGDIPVTVTTGNVTTQDAALSTAPVYEDFAAPAGWSVSNDPLTTTGFWVFEEPFGTFSGGIPFQTDLDHTLDPETICAVTGNATSGALGFDDVDGGATRLLSPAFDLSAMAEPHVFYYRWYAVNDEVDQWQVEATSDGGANWTLLESSAIHEAFWKSVDIDLTGMFSPATAIQFRFTAEDPDPGQLVEAALDDFTIYDAAGGGTVGVPAVPGRGFGLELAQNSPNPFPARTQIRFSIPAKGPVELSVFDVRGARVATLVDGILEPGVHRADWDGRTYTGGQAASGVYFYKLRTKTEIRTRKMIRVN